MKINFDKRPAIGGPVFAGSYNIGDKIEPWEPIRGNIATLHSGKVTILVRISEVLDQTYKGEIIGFENCGDIEYDGLSAGSVVDFTYDEAFGFSR